MEDITQELHENAALKVHVAETQGHISPGLYTWWEQSVSPFRLWEQTRGWNKPWLEKTMHVRRVSTRLGEVDWGWDGHEMRVTIGGCRCNVRLGSRFPLIHRSVLHTLASSGTRFK